MFKLAIYLCFIIGAVYPAKRGNFREKINLRISVYNFPPFCIIKEGPNGTLEYSGYQIEYLNWISKAINANMVYVPVRLDAIKTVGLYQATINQLLADEVDVANSLIFPSIERAAHIEFTTPIISTQYVMMLPYPREKHRIGALVRPFSNEVWLLQIITFIVVALTIALLSSRSTVSIRILRSFGYVYNILVSQGDYLPYSSRTLIRIVAGLWCLMVLILANAYSGSLTSFMTARELEALPKSLEDFVADKRYHISMEKNTLLTDLFLNADSGNFKIIGDMLRKNPHLMISSNQSVAIANVLEHNAAFVTGEEFTKILISADLKKIGHCRLTFSPFMSVSQSYLRFGLQIRGQHNELINKKIWYAWERGLKSQWGRKFMNPIDKCLLIGEKTNAREKIAPLSLKELSSVFLILGVGYTASAFVIALERILNKFSVRKA